MSYLPIAKTVPQYVDPATGLPYSGAVLKAYASGTSNVISLSIDAAGSTLVTSMALNSGGFPEVSGTIVIPYVNEDFKLALYPTQAAADSNTGAIWNPDGIPITDTSSNFAATDTGTGDAYEIALTLSPSVYTAGQRLQFIPAANNTGACTLNINSLGTRAIKLLNGEDPYNDAIITNMMVDVMDNGTYYFLMNPNVDFGSEITKLEFFS